MLAAIDMIVSLLSSDIVSSVGAILGADTGSLSYSVAATQCTPKTCPGSFYTAITTAWANIGYLTHADVLRFLNGTNFGKWAILLYIVAAITGLLGVATNSPMRNYTWFFIGPALFSFLVGTTMPVTGVNWVVANKAVKDMSEVWKNAETGLANTRLAKDGVVRINGKEGPTSQYEVAMPMVFLDELFSATSNILIEWTGIGRQVAGTGRNTNLANPSPNLEGPWWLMSTLKWEYLENIVSATARNPDVRDALVTFLGSECGDRFKEGINSGAYIAAAQARGMTPVKSVMIEDGKNNYEKFLMGLNNTSINAPRSLARLFKEGKSLTAVSDVGPMPGVYDPNQPNYIAPSFLNFSKSLLNAMPSGRGHGIVCSEYLWTIVQALRFEAGHAYYQLTRSAPSGFDEKQFVSTLIYGWNVRKKPDGTIAQADEQEAFVKHLILAYIVRNELLFAPAITSVDQRFAPAVQAKSYSDANIRSYGSKAKFIELYNAAIMMPYLQGILAYFLIVAYPIACMLVILPGHYKGFITWVSFFAWIKLWDVGFAMVQVIERSVWAMIGNHSHLASTANVLIETAERVGGIGVTNPVGPGQGNGYGVLSPSNLAAQGAVPIVCSLASMNGECSTSTPGDDQTLPKAAELLDKLLLTSANIDLDLSNGWYIYIMSALYLAVPAVTGQLVLGAKAGSAGLVKDAFQAVGSDGSQAAKAGAQHKDVAALQSNSGSVGQAAYAKAMSQGTGADKKGPSLAMQSYMSGNSAMDMGRESRGNQLTGQALSNAHQVAGMVRGSFNNASQLVGAGQKGVQDLANGSIDTYGAAVATGSGGGGGAGSGKSAGLTGASTAVNALGNLNSTAQAAGNVALGRAEHQRGVASLAAGQNLSWQGAALDMNSNGMRDYGGKLASQAEFDAQSAAWEARNDFASHASAMGGIAGMNSGALSPGHKPHERDGMAMTGMFDGYATGRDGKAQAVASQSASTAASYGGTSFQTGTNAWRDKGIAEYGASRVAQPWVEQKGAFSAAGAEAFGVIQGANSANLINSSSDNSYNLNSLNPTGEDPGGKKKLALQVQAEPDPTVRAARQSIESSLAPPLKK